MVRELGGGGRAALVGAALYLFIPVTWFDSVVWGQVDSVGLVFVLLAIRSLWRDQPELAVVFTVIAGVVKIQLGVILVPITAAVLLRRYVWDGSGSTGAWRGPRRLLTSLVAGLGTAAVLGAPFSLSILDLIDQVRKTAGGYPYLTVNAYNPWALVTQAGAGLAQSGQWLCDSITGTAADTPCPPGSETLIGPFWASFVADSLLIVIAALVAVMVARRPDRQTILVGLAVLAIAFFVVPTRVHERYMFPFFAVAAILAAVSWRWLVGYLVLAGAAFLNMYVVLTTLYPDNPQIHDWLGIGPSLRSFVGVATIAAVHTLGLAWAALQWRRASQEALEDEIADAGDRAPAPVPIPRPERPSMGDVPPRPGVAGAWLPSAAVADGLGAAGGFGAAGASRLDEGGDMAAGATRSPGPAAMAAPAGAYLAGRSVSPAGPDLGPTPARRWPAVLDPLLRRLSPGPLRADRSRLLAREAGGRLDRLDLWLVIWLVIASLLLRMWRLDEPASMHFDEVYHARTATEFLQDWRYGLSHNVYEWTHPHLAKYAMALGIVAWGDDRVTAGSDLGVTVLDAAIEPRWDDSRLPDARAGDRLYVATGAGPGGLRVYDLATRQLITSFDLPGITGVAVDTDGHQVFAVTGDGSVYALDTSLELDPLRTGTSASGLAPPARIGSFGGPVKGLFATSDGSFLVAIAKNDDVIALDASTGALLSRVHLAGAADIASAGKVEGLVADPSAIADPAAVAKTLASLMGGDAKAIQTRLTGTGHQRVVAASVDATVRPTVEAAIGDGRLDGLSFQQLSTVAVADSAGVAIVSPSDGSIGDDVPISGGATGLVLTSNLDAPRLYVATGTTLTVLKLSDDGAAHVAPSVETTIKMPGPVTRVTFDAASVIVHALGTTPDGTASTVYAVEPHANSVFADARLPFAPAAWATDVQEDYPSADRQAILAFDAAGSVASVDIGMHEFSWRMPGVIAGALTAGLLFLLTRLLFRRREVGVLVAILALADGMLFVQARIAMNDVYVGLFILAAYVLFAGLWLGRWRFRGAFWVLMPVIGLLLGLALASKWVAAYAIAAMGLLILVRSALGRLLTILALVAATVYLGYQGLIVAVATPGEVILSGPNYLFMLLMIGLTLLATIVTILHPIAWSVDEVRFAIGAPAALGIVIGLVAIPLASQTSTLKVGPVTGSPTSIAMDVAIGLLLLAAAVAASFALAGRFGFGPMAPPLAPGDPARLAEPPAEPPAPWLRLGSYLGLPAAWMGLCLVLLPVAVYVVSYIPWALNSGGVAGSPLIFPAGTPLIGAWPPGHDGQTLWQLTGQMYDYHNNLRAAHAAASPWWAWPLDLKPVWFYQGSFAGGTSAAIYDAGNLAIWWLGVPAMGFIAWQAFKRRSLALALVAVAFAFQWLSWSRIDRATFQYHYYTSVPFIIVAVAYLLAELWHGASRRTWLFARVAAAVAVMGPALFWAFKGPLCALVDVNRAYKDSLACTGSPANLVITDRIGVVLALVVIAVIVIVYRLSRLGGPAERGGRPSRAELLPILAVAGIAAVLIELATLVLGDRALIDVRGMSTEPVAVVALLILAGVAWFIATARDARRFVLGALIAIVGEFVAFYPNLAALPMPSTIFNAYQGFLPTFLYPFQFPVNTDPVPAKMPSVFAADPNLFNLPPALVLGGVLLIACAVVAYSAWSWRVVLAGRSETPTDPGDGLRA
ncbi:MAG TPA: phospholipid carrier-dependent glycosyltransferase [Candidatus Limnocylindrales bacterium]